METAVKQTWILSFDHKDFGTCVEVFDDYAIASAFYDGMELLGYDVDIQSRSECQTVSGALDILKGFLKENNDYNEGDESYEPLEASELEDLFKGL